MKRSAIINVVGLTRSLIGAHTPAIKGFLEKHSCQVIKPAFPAVTCTAQSTYLTGKQPNEHGIVGNAWYDREYDELRFWKQSNRLVQQPKLWEDIREEVPEFTCAKLFWWYNMYSSADYSITPRPMYPADGRKVFDIYTQPMGLRESIKQDLGEFPFPYFWGPMAGIESSAWIAKSAQWVETKYQPTLNLIYLPHLDYNLQRLGPNHPDIAKDLKEIDRVVGELLDFFTAHDIEVTLLSEYGITEVDQPIHLNRVFRKNGWITIKDELGLEQLDFGASKVFALADHQVAHIYVNDKSILSQVRQQIEQTDGVDQVLDAEAKTKYGIDHSRAGDLIAIAKPHAWFTYYYWEDDALAPDFARCVDIHRKAGYDPVELFIDPKLSLPKLKVAKFLLKKKLGFRALMDVIPLDASLVRGSHGRIPENENDWPVLIGPQVSEGNQPINATKVYSKLKASILS
ncbi:alkaline phosphatase family protein [Rubellicoccus peritrichatus]|uniref:Alkaline phosphatase family protein n=1 Tax=Rubellicoccus peritrichatus TaxID=3080537 RepID=A0AAQ3LG39_9BACT|nr:alkaline phosphatase family protein [Puniceicoccus sp. CR14]WOO41494.1 alkaline phosphatase family protein [Puniceicoccus sp. CR14]